MERDPRTGGLSRTGIRIPRPDDVDKGVQFHPILNPREIFSKIEEAGRNVRFIQLDFSSRDSTVGP